MKILLAGGTGNIGTFLARHLQAADHEVRILVHRRPPPPGFEAIRGDLDDAATLPPACAGVEAIFYSAGVLFRPHPERFLERTNVEYVRNLLRVARAAGVRRFVLLSFPHADAPGSVHFRTRRAAERVLLEADGIEIVILRAGTVYGRGVKMIETARRLLRLRLLFVWPEPTWIHLLSLPDLLASAEYALTRSGLRETYEIADDEPILLQDALDHLAAHWGTAPPRRISRRTLLAVARVVERIASILGTAAPLTPEFVRAGFISSIASTGRARRAGFPLLRFPTWREGFPAILRMTRGTGGIRTLDTGSTPV